MKWVHTGIVGIIAFLFSTGISFGAALDDLDLTIRVVESDDLTEMHNELSLPDTASDAAREHAEDDDGRGLTQADQAREEERQEDSNDVNRDDAEFHDEAREEREDEIEDHDEAREDSSDVNEEHDEAREEESHEHEHDQQDN
jgi:hypothetical protein